MDGLGRVLKNIVLPIFCRQCGIRLLTEENGYFCPTCWEASPRVTRPFCSICGRSHKGMVGFGTVNNFPCADCRENPAPPYGRIFGAAAYAGAVRDAIKLLKFEGKTRLAGPLADLLIEFIHAELDAADYDYVMPVPLHRVRQRARGFNQSALLTEQILPFFREAALNESLRRIRPTRTLSLTKDPAERRANVRGAFAVVGPELAGARVLLVDDVVTTGCTVAECARALNRAGASRVHVLAVALA